MCGVGCTAIVDEVFESNALLGNEIKIWKTIMHPTNPQRIDRRKGFCEYDNDIWTLTGSFDFGKKFPVTLCRSVASVSKTIMEIYDIE